MAVTDVWADWSSTAASNSPAGAATPEVDDELRNIKAQCKGNVPVAATQANQETGTSLVTFVSPGRQQFHQSAAKVWAIFGVAGDLTAGGYNATSVTDNGNGSATLNLTTAFSGSTYCTVGIARSSQARIVTISDGGQSTGAFQILAFDAAGNAADPVVGYQVAAFGDQ